MKITSLHQTTSLERVNPESGFGDVGEGGIVAGQLGIPMVGTLGDGQTWVFDTGSGTLIPGDVGPGIDLQDDGVSQVNPATVLNFRTGVSVDSAGNVDVTAAGLDAELNIEGGQSVIKPHGAMGSTETFDPTDGNVHTGTFDANCTFTLNPPTGSGDAVLRLKLTEDGTGGWSPTWPGSVVWVNGVTPTHDTTAGSTTIYVLETSDGGTTWFASAGGGQITVKDEGTPLATAAASLDFVGAGVTASGTGAEKTITIPGGGAPSGTAGGDLSGTYPNPSVVDDSHNHTTATLPAVTEATVYGVGGHWEVLMDPATSSPPVPLTTPDGTDWVYGWVSDGG